VIPYTTDPADILPPTWLLLSPGRLITAEPLRSSDGRVTYARLSYRSALQVAASLGAELPTRDDLLALHEVARAAGTELTPVTLPTRQMCWAAKVDDTDQAAVQRFRVANMQGEEWCAAHDELVLMARGGRGDLPGPWGNIGKQWIAGASPGRSRLMGWALPNGTWIQSGLYPVGDTHEAHDDGYADYSSTVILVRAA